MFGGVVVGFVVVLVVVIVAAVAAEFYLRGRIQSEVESAASSSLGAPASAQLDGFALVTAATHRTDGVHLTSDGGTKPDGTPAPAVDIDLTNVELTDAGATAASLSGTATIGPDAMLAVAQEQAGDDLLGQLTAVKSVTPNADAGTLDVQIGGVATAQLVPRVDNGQLSLDPQNAEVMGMQLPESVLGGTISLVQQTVDALPEGVTITGAHVSDAGLVIDLQGDNVDLRK